MCANNGMLVCTKDNKRILIPIDKIDHIIEGKNSNFIVTYKQVIDVGESIDSILMALNALKTYPIIYPSNEEV